MDFEEKYIAISEETVKPDETKITISDEAYAIGEMIQKLIMRLSLK